MRKVVIVTGGSRGIGATTCRLLAAQGYSVCVNYRSRADEAQAVVSAIESSGGSAFSYAADVSNEQDVMLLFDAVEAHLGPITHLVNNAGILFPQSRLSDLTAERINKVLTTNVTGYFLCCREAVKRMKNGGAIVNVSSVAARTGSPNEYIDYAASKGAIDTLTKGLSLEVAAQNIRVNGPSSDDLLIDGVKIRFDPVPPTPVMRAITFDGPTLANVSNGPHVVVRDLKVFPANVVRFFPPFTAPPNPPYYINANIDLSQA